MAWLMVHLTVSRNTAVSLDADWQMPDLMTGSIAPDSVHEHPGWDRRMKNRFHLRRVHEPLGRRFHRAQLFWERFGSSNIDGLVAGWVSHVVTDWLWTRHFARYFLTEFLPSVDRTELVRLWNHECKVSDAALGEANGIRIELLEDLTNGRPKAIPGYADSQAIERWRVGSLAREYEDRGNPSDQVGYLTKERIQRFIELATSVCAMGFDAGFCDAYESIVARTDANALLH